MTHSRFLSASLAVIALLSSAAALAQDAASPPSPGEIVAAAPAEAWTRIAPRDLLVMDLAPDAQQRPRRVVIQLMSAPFAQGWVANIRTLAAAHWWDGLSINRVQDNYVVQWGDPADPDKGESGKALPANLLTMDETNYLSRLPYPADRYHPCSPEQQANAEAKGAICVEQRIKAKRLTATRDHDAYAPGAAFYAGWPVGYEEAHGEPIPLPDGGIGEMREVFQRAWPVHCYGMVGVGRNLSPDTGTGAELYTVIGHAPRHLDRNIALVGRVIEGIEHLSSLPRGTGPLGFYEQAQQRVPIRSVRLGDAIADLPAYEHLDTDSDSFARYADARANRRDAFFIRPAGGADICNMPVPVRRVKP